MSSPREERRSSSITDRSVTPPLAGTGTGLRSQWPATLAELHLRLAETEDALQRAHQELFEMQQRVREAYQERDEAQAALREARERMAEDLAGRIKAEESLRASEERFRLMGDAIPFGVWMSNADGGLKYASQSFLDLIEMSMEEAQGLGWTKRLAPQDREPAMKRWLSHLPTGEDWEIEHRILGPDGQYHTVLTRGKPVRDHQGRIISWVGINLDITTRKRIELSLAAHVRELAQSNAELEQFASVVSHDLRAPLTSIGGCAHLIGELLEDRLDDDLGELLDNLKSSVEHMGRLIQSLLRYSRVGKEGLKLNDCDVEKVLSAVLMDLKAAITASGARLTHDRLPVVQADEGLLAHLLQNLIENAIKYRGNDPPVVHISAEIRGDQWVFSVRDNGIGIDPRYFDKIFVMFQRLHGDESRYSGLGMGLATCKKIVDRHGGQLWVESVPGAGSTFYFSLPRG